MITQIAVLCWSFAMGHISGDLSMLVLLKMFKFRQFHQRHKERLTQDWYSSVNSSIRCHHYMYFKSILETERYLSLDLFQPFISKEEFSRQCFSESPMSGEYFGRLIATGEWGVCLLSSVKYVTLKIEIFLRNLYRLIFYLYILNILCSLVLLYRKLNN